MEKPLYVIEPFKHGADFWLIFSISIVVLSLVGACYFRKNKSLDYNRRNIMVMILGFFAVISFCTTVFRLYSKWRLQPIEIYNNRIKTPYGDAPLSNILDSYIKLEIKYKPMQAGIAQDSAHYLFIIERSNKTHVLSEGDYPIIEVLDKLNETMR